MVCQHRDVLRQSHGTLQNENGKFFRPCTATALTLPPVQACSPDRPGAAEPSQGHAALRYRTSHGRLGSHSSFGGLTAFLLVCL